MRRRHHSFKERVLVILERVAELWANAFILFVTIPALDKRLNTREEFEEAKRLLFKADAHITRAICRTARRLAGLPRIACPIEAFYRRPFRRSGDIYWFYLDCVAKLKYARRRAIRMAWRWRRETERKQRDPLCDLRGDLSAATDSCLHLSRGGGGGRRTCAASTQSIVENTSPAPC
jgi:hypothetical protein